MSTFTTSIHWVGHDGPCVTEYLIDGVCRSSGSDGRAHIVSTARGPNSSTGTVGPVTVVGSFRLDGGDSLTGEEPAVGVAAAFLERGTAALDLVDGDFSFVLWDERAQTALAVRDRFAVESLFIARMRDSVHISNHYPDVLASLARPIEPDPRGIRDHLAGGTRWERSTVVAGVARVPAASAVLLSRSEVRELEYWSPRTIDIPADDLIDTFRAKLQDSVARRTSTVGEPVVAHLSGGLDSSGIAAALYRNDAADARRRLTTTTSVRFPTTDADEGRWIHQTVTMHRTGHVDAVARPASMQETSEDIASLGGPAVPRIREIWRLPVTTASTLGASQILSGVGGDEVLDQDQVHVDRLRSAPFLTGVPDLVKLGRKQPSELRWVLRMVARSLLPERFSVRSSGGGTNGYRGLAQPALAPHASASRRSTTERPAHYPTWSQAGIIERTRHPGIARHTESERALQRPFGVTTTYPYLDRSLVELVASVRPQDRPMDGRSKTLVRQAFVDDLPSAVVARRRGTVADTFLAEAIVHQAPEYQRRFPRVPESAVPYIDRERYRSALQRAVAGEPETVDTWALWPAWTLMQWLEERHDTGELGDGIVRMS